jgi:uracil-DNA glycosylase
MLSKAGNLQEKNYVLDVLTRLEQENSFKDGFKLLYCPWERLNDARVAFISLNPGRAPVDYETRTIEDTRGNSYIVERDTTKSPLTDQFLKMCEFLGASPSEVLTGAFFPFRSMRWKDLNGAQIEAGVDFARSFWRNALSDRCELVIAVGRLPAENLVELLGCQLESEIDSQWSNVKLRRYVNSSGKTVVQLPHLSRIKLFSRAACTRPLKEIFKILDR